jgi:peptidoglycan-associated lipoprotein
MFRLRATADGGGRGASAVILTCVALLTAALWAGAAAADDRRERLIGTFDLEAAEAAPPRDATDAVVRPAERRGPAQDGAQDVVDEATEELLSDALAELSAGRTENAQRLFEQLIARAPASSLAGEARRYLADLYRGADADAHRGHVAPPDFSGRRVAQPLPAEGEARDPSEISREPFLMRAVPVSSGLEDQFIAEAGDRVFFSAGSAELGSRARGVLAAQARFILRRADLGATIEGHSDDPSLTPDQHVRLSEARAEAVRQRLVSEGIEPSRLAIVALGRERPVSDCQRPECAAQNRRAVTVLFINGARGNYGTVRGRAAAGAPAASPRSTPLTQ